MGNLSDIELQIKQDLKSVSKIQIEHWKNKALNDTAYLNAAVKIGLTNEKPYCWRCSWIISKVASIDNSLIEPYIDLIINSLGNFKFDSQIGGFLKTLIYIKEIHEDYCGIIADYCIKKIYDTQRPSYHKYYAIQLLLRIAKKYPDLAREFSLIVEENLPYFTKPYLRKFGKESILRFSNL